MRQKKSLKLKFKDILRSKLVISILIFIAVSLVAVIAGDIIVKEGAMDVSGNLTTTGTGTFGGLNVTGNTSTTYIKLNELSGVCDLSTNHSICSNATGTYIIG